MEKNINDDVMIDFLLDETLEKNHSHIANLVLTNPNVQETYKKNKEFIDIHRYLNNEMSLHESIEFEIKRKNNPDLEKDIQLLEDIDLVCFLESVAKNYFTEKEKEKLPESEKPDSQAAMINFSKKIIRLSAAAILLFCFTITGSMRLQMKSNTLGNKLFAEYYVSNANEESLLLDNYFVEDDKTSYPGSHALESDMLKQLRETNTLESQSQLLLIGINYIKQEKFDDAISVLFELFNNENFTDNTLKLFTAWNLAMCFLQEEKITEAKVVLKHVANSGAYKNKEAKEILKKLNKTKT